jgi:hypothetical protein
VRTKSGSLTSLCITAGGAGLLFLVVALRCIGGGRGLELEGFRYRERSGHRRARARSSSSSSSSMYPHRCEVRQEVRAAAGEPRPQTERYRVQGLAAGWLTIHAVSSTGGAGEYVTAATAQAGMSLRSRSGGPWNLWVTGWQPFGSVPSSQNSSQSFRHL